MSMIVAVMQRKVMCLLPCFRQRHYDLHDVCQFAPKQLAQNWHFVQVVLPHYSLVCDEEGLTKNSQAMLLEIDVYAVHTCQEFRTWLFDTYPFIHISYVPGKCQSMNIACQRLHLNVADSNAFRLSMSASPNSSDNAR